MSSHRTRRATSRYESKTTEPLFSDPPAAYTEDDADEGRKSSSDEVSEHGENDEPAEIDDVESSVVENSLSSEPDESSTPRPNKGKEREHTPTDNEDEQEINDRNEPGESRSSEDEDNSEEVETDDNENPDQTRRDTVYHWQIWDELVSHANGGGRFHYVYDPRRGLHNDVTAYEPSQARWGEDRAHRPAILSQWDPPMQNPVYKIGTISYNDHTVVDWERQSLRAFKGLPLTISSAVAGFRIEAWLRSDSRMQYRDIEARMRTKVGRKGREPIFGRRALASRASYFRDRAGCVSWASRKTLPTCKAFMDNLRTPAQRANNLTAERDLTGAEMAAFHALTRGKGKQTSTTEASGKSTPSIALGQSSSASTDQVQTAASSPRSRTPRSIVPPLSERIREISVEESSSNDLEETLSDDQSIHDEQYLETQTPSNPEEQNIENGSDISEFPSDEPEDPNDSRNDAPSTLEEAQILQQALERTIQEYYELTGGQVPTHAPPEDNYFSQWYHYQSQFAIVWRQLGNTHEPPRLFGLGRWTGGIANWETADGISVSENEE